MRIALRADPDDPVHTWAWGVWADQEPFAPYDYVSAMHDPPAHLDFFETIPAGPPCRRAGSRPAMSTASRGYSVTMIATDPPGLPVLVGGMAYTAPATFRWAEGSEHVLEVSASVARGDSRLPVHALERRSAGARVGVAPAAADGVHFENRVVEIVASSDDLNLSGFGWDRGLHRLAWGGREFRVRVTKPVAVTAYVTRHPVLWIEATGVPRDAWAWRWSPDWSPAQGPLPPRLKTPVPDWDNLDYEAWSAFPAKTLEAGSVRLYVHPGPTGRFLAWDGGSTELWCIVGVDAGSDMLTARFEPLFELVAHTRDIGILIRQGYPAHGSAGEVAVRAEPAEDTHGGALQILRRDALGVAGPALEVPVWFAVEPPPEAAADGLEGAGLFQPAGPAAGGASPRGGQGCRGSRRRCRSST